MEASPSQTWPIILNLIAAAIGALGQYLYKLGSARLGAVAILKNWPIFVGAALFCVVMVLFVIGFRLGGKLSVCYPAYATTFIWGMLLASWLDGEKINTFQVSGVLAICFGVALIAFGHAGSVT
ncbi:MAG TPA: hypothetical protein DCS07_03455 [Bdellovibrionales bacterium]|nr:MAG: hypothetical protein A2Z97_00880 [Bdellovibrionales bacterium GWB1_52_6]OFZ05187.1 MAG: hypothetical protein A2X97_10360 [Bdellovibrionales bacterium GWA1_52_35]OFZ39266.1 MAG: hypothetical protein A2070_13240 [Bdellovibrionales bacterium GWC1_52_8]HAR41675.1 hypothetical protein [Bdellovibrionales bacterium]HCM38683.1 hypothetical protein [Bdellovibrionales bacterium]